MKRNINFKNVLCMAAITLVTGMLGGCEDNSIATPVGKLPNETALDNNFGMLKCDMTTSDLEITMTNTKTPDFAFFYQTVKPVAQDTRITMKIDLDLVDKYNEEHGTEYRKMSTISIEGISNDGAMTIKAGDTMSDTIMVRLNPLGTLHDYSLLPITVELPEESGIRPSRDSNEIYYKIYYKRSTYPWLSPMKADMKKYKMVGFIDGEKVNASIAKEFIMVLYDNETFGPGHYELWETSWYAYLYDIINVNAATLGYANGKVTLNQSANFKKQLSNMSSLSSYGIKRCVTLKAEGTGLGFCNLTDEQIRAFVAEVKKLANYRVDGINLMDEGAEYGINGHPAANATSYPKLIKALRESLGKTKLITVTITGDPAGSLASEAAGIRAGEYIDYAWTWVNTKIMNPWEDSSIEKPIAGLDKSQYGGFSTDEYTFDYENDESYPETLREKLYDKGLGKLYIMRNIPFWSDALEATPYHANINAGAAAFYRVEGGHKYEPDINYLHNGKYKDMKGDKNYYEM